MEEKKNDISSAVAALNDDCPTPFIGGLGFGNRVDSKATAMQYAIGFAIYYDEQGRHVDKEKALEIYKLFTDNMELPDVPMSDLMKTLTETVQEYKKQLKNGQPL